MTTILLVEDCLTDAGLLTHYLMEAGLTVVTAITCEEARLKLQFQRPDLVLLDVILPGQSGFEFCRELKTNTKTEQIPVIICSTKGTHADKLWGTMLGADAYLSKPIDPHELLALIARLIGTALSRFQ